MIVEEIMYKNPEFAILEDTSTVESNIVSENLGTCHGDGITDIGDLITIITVEEDQPSLVSLSLITTEEIGFIKN